MALLDLMTELRGSVPKLPFAFSKTLINRAWNDIRNSNLWSFQLYEQSWITPAPVNTGTVTVTQGSATVTLDAAANAAVNAASTSFSLITQRQFRIAVGGIYNIIAYDNVGSTLTLDRVYGDPSATGAAYQIYQLYYTPQFQDHLTWFSVRNPTMYLNLILNRTRAWLDARDPQRSWYQFPTHVVSWGLDLRGAGTVNASATLNYPMYELWGQPVTIFTYQCYGIRRGADLVNPNDTLPVQVPQELVIARAKRYAYEWAEANKEVTPRASGPDFKFLLGASNQEYRELLIKFRKQDRELVDNWFSIREPGLASHAYGYYNSIAGVAGPYTQL